MPLTDADLANIASEVWNRFKVHTATGDVSLADALARIIKDLEVKP